MPTWRVALPSGRSRTSPSRWSREATWSSAAVSTACRQVGSLQIEDGDWSAGLTAQQSADIADLLESMAQAIRQTRALAGAVQSGFDPVEGARRSVETVLRTGLPLNRKERFYTGTVLPMIAAWDGFAHLDRLLGLCGLPSAGLEGNALEGRHPVQFFTEYNFAESPFTSADMAQFAAAPLDAYTPDVVIVGTDWLLCRQAFHQGSVPSRPTGGGGFFSSSVWGASRVPLGGTQSGTHAHLDPRTHGTHPPPPVGRSGTRPGHATANTAQTSLGRTTRRTAGIGCTPPAWS